ncbi:MAG: cupin domain-containing protein [Pyrinomonadaceae bacterium]|nr:cupin domain-containing protein [Pyrinomonadaceae bacterium]
MSLSPFHLESLLAPVTLNEFFSDYWEEAPLVVSHDEPGRYRALLEISDIDFILSSAFTADKTAVEALGASEDKKSLKEVSATQVSELYDAYHRGSTVRVNRVHHNWKPIGELCRSLEQSFKFPVRANLYCTPASASTSPRHYDTHDVLVLQISGRKSWRIFKPLVPLPLETVPPLPFEERTSMLKYARGGPRKARANIDDDECGEPLKELTLTTGDLLYIPRGFLHEAWTTDEPSTHITVGLHVVRWLDLLSVALAQVSNRDVRFRQALPTGLDARDDLKELFSSLADVFAQQANLRDATEELASSFVQSRQAVGDGTLAGSSAADIDGNTLLEHRPGLLFRFAQNGGAVGIVSAHSALWMPPGFDEALRFIAKTREFRAGDIPGAITNNSKLSLARRLIQDGFMRIAGTVG